ncbi:hypothetical protein ACLOJK_025457 [Asimina triloba]
MNPPVLSLDPSSLLASQSHRSQAIATVYNSYVSSSSSRSTVIDYLTVTLSSIFHFVSTCVLPILVSEFDHPVEASVNCLPKSVLR